jgi:hypothetical protein
LQEADSTRKPIAQLRCEPSPAINNDDLDNIIKTRLVWL